MIKNKLLKVLTSMLAVGTLLIIIWTKSNENPCKITYDIALAIFGSSLLAWLVAIVEQWQDRRLIQRTTIKNILKVQEEIKRIMWEYNKILDKWEPRDFREAADKIRSYIGEFYAYNDVLKLENGKRNNYFGIEIIKIYGDFSYMANGCIIIENLLNDNKRDEAYSRYEKCKSDSRAIADSIATILTKEYGKKFTNSEVIGLL